MATSASTKTKRGWSKKAALRHLVERDPALGRLIERVGDFTLVVDALHSPFAALAQAIMHQQITGKAAATIVRRFKERLGEGDAFPTPEAVLAASDETLRAVGLSRSKALAMRDLAAKSIDGTVPSEGELHAMEDEPIAERLTQVRGIGLWTVHMLLLFRLGRPDVLPSTDYGVRKGFMVAFRGKELPSPKEIAMRAERWRPYRSVASWYLWRALELPEKAPRRSLVVAKPRRKR
jgi:3-methyladenine DNA glycosylase/8-oxoguanine DNA glycosylase